MGSKTFDGVWFICYVHDHLPPHVHGRYGGTVVVVEWSTIGKIRLSRRRKAIRPPNAKKSDVKHILDTARAHADEFVAIWEAAHG